ncbi:MAG: TIGR04282 family arsenosugar biosynthesis glycosyltransferase [Balneolaceae bacterium]
MLKEERLLIFIKNPTAGKVKTRLAAAIGNDKALEVYKALMAYTQEITAGVDVHRQVWYSSYIDDADDWSMEYYDKRLQIGNDLGARMNNAFHEAFDEDCTKVVIIGSDCPGLTSNHIKEAFLQLAKKDCVIGPSEDGGYYLLGLSKRLPELFKDREWSTESVLEESVDTLENHRFSYELLEELNDIDNEEDLKKSNFKPELLD